MLEKNKKKYGNPFLSQSKKKYRSIDRQIKQANKYCDFISNKSEFI